MNSINTFSYIDSFPKNTLITGRRSTGKTTLIQKIIKQILQQNPLYSHIIWVSNIKPDKIINFNSVHFTPYENSFSVINNFLLLNKDQLPLFIVFDNIIYSNKSGEDTLRYINSISNHKNVYCFLTAPYPLGSIINYSNIFRYIVSFNEQLYTTQENLYKLYNPSISNLEFKNEINNLTNYSCLVKDNFSEQLFIFNN